mgnify:CR=1 FL=1
MYYIKDLLKNYWKYTLIPFVPFIICILLTIVGIE